MNGRISARVRRCSRRLRGHPPGLPAPAPADPAGCRLPSVAALAGRTRVTARHCKRIPVGLTTGGGLIRTRSGGVGLKSTGYRLDPNPDASTGDAGVTGDIRTFFGDSAAGVTPMSPEGWRGGHRGVTPASPGEWRPCRPDPPPSLKSGPVNAAGSRLWDGGDGWKAEDRTLGMQMLNNDAEVDPGSQTETETAAAIKAGHAPEHLPLGRNLLTDPVWEADSLGWPLPVETHAVSVSLPCWRDVVDYEEGSARVTSAMRAGYPRFFIHPLVEELFGLAEKTLAREGEGCLVFPSRAAARRAAAYAEKRGAERLRLEPFGFGGRKPDGGAETPNAGTVPENGTAAALAAASGGGPALTAVCFPEEFRKLVRECWRYCGETLSSRLAERVLAEYRSLEKTNAHADAVTGTGTLKDIADVLAAGAEAKRLIKERLAAVSGVAAGDVFLFSSGMTAVAASHRAVMALRPGLPTVQLDFPYVDVLRVQQEFGSGVEFFPVADGASLARVRELASQGAIAGVFCETPSNPLLSAVPVDDLAPALRAAGIPLVIDDTVATSVNLNALVHADLVTTSLTKAFSGVGNVMAGAVTVNPASPHHAILRRFLEAELAEHDPLWAEDAVVLEENSRDFTDRAHRMNAGAEALTDWLSRHPAVERVHYPRDQSVFGAMARPGGGRGCLFSFILKDAAVAAGVYDRLHICKGPSLGTNFSLCCPYTLLAHYTELEWAAECGVPAHLLRVSVGLEPPEELISRFAEAMKNI
ncbi:MAG: Cystathionine gamma-synthase [Verrucomicrobiales bacterium]|nr:Cystathionine gamma-synthase [Verrucomicrobiales bacterium]